MKIKESDQTGEFLWETPVGRLAPGWLVCFFGIGLIAIAVLCGATLLRSWFKFMELAKSLPPGQADDLPFFVVGISLVGSLLALALGIWLVSYGIRPRPAPGIKFFLNGVELDSSRGRIFYRFDKLKNLRYEVANPSLQKRERRATYAFLIISLLTLNPGGLGFSWMKLNEIPAAGYLSFLTPENRKMRIRLTSEEYEQLRELFGREEIWS
jgi:hypothetical protein